MSSPDPGRSHRFPVRVYYEDTDFSGNVYHAAYLHFFERGRTEFLRAEGIHHSELIGEGIAFAVRSMEIDFPRAAHIDDELVVDTAVLEISGARLTLDQSIERGDELIARAKVVVVAIRTDGRATRLPRSLVAAFST
ncbi:tol-pal system-associated acyl-CoA thioesterase [Devosia sp. 66-22]|uniref:tol-pal system-associated acyl-CoA thioesterase n=1 Tax=Devosia sp. 66-22 TaxID=1895753 RepID=UPI00260D472F|nr:tol-pal system-associated acyl-CoA thioesterase [Devosia sp. 66-22]